MIRKWLRRLCLYGPVGCLALVLVLASQPASSAAGPQNPASKSPSGQASPPPAAPQPAATGQTEEPTPYKLGPVTVFNVTTPVTVFDSGGQLVYDLEKEEFKVYDNGQLQDIAGFDNELRALSLVIIVETNDSTAAFLDSVRPLGSMFSEMVMGPQGQVAVLTYSDHVDMPLGFTSDGDKLDTVLRGLHARGSGMHLDDAVNRALSMLTTRPLEDRKVIVIFSEGFNLGSKISRGEIYKGAMNSNITIYGLGFSPVKGLWKRPAEDPKPDLVSESVARSMPPNVAPTPTNAENIWDTNDISFIPILLGIGEEAKKPFFKSALISFANYSGGRYYQKWGKDTVQQALNQIATEIHSQYELAYNPKAELQPGQSIAPGFHSIKVEVRRPGAKVRSRVGWYYQGEVPTGVRVR